MQKIRIGTDSTADIPQSFCEELNISVLPLIILADGKEFARCTGYQPEEILEVWLDAKTEEIREKCK